MEKTTTMPEFKSMWSYNSFAHRIINRNRYIRDAETDEFLATLLESAKRRKKARLRKNSGFWRAQIGSDQRKVYLEDDFIDYEPCPYDSKRMKPIPDKAREGRANPKGIPCLYGATEWKTALAEVRPWLGQYISLASFKALKDLTLMNFVTPDPKHTVYFAEPKPREREAIVWAVIDRAFAAPVSPNDETADYAPTQIIAELFKDKGFDGIAYRSSLGAGFNIALFDIGSADLVSCTLYQLDSIEHNFSEIGK